MKKLLFLFGILILFIGVGIYKPVEVEDALEQATIRDVVWENVRVHLVTVYEEQLEAHIELEMLGYVCMGLGLLFILVSFRGKKKDSKSSGGGVGQLLYQALERISPHELGEKAKRDKEKEDKLGIKKVEEKSMELPDIDEPVLLGASGASPASGYPPLGGSAPGPTMTPQPADRPVNPLKSLFHKTGASLSGGLRGKRPTGPGKKFKCAACEEVFVVKHNDSTITCPSCNTTYKIK